MSVPKRVVVEYEDGSTKGVEFSRVSKDSCLELSRLGLCPPPSAVPKAAENYIILRWSDGWKEVFGIEKSNVDLLRYYVIERTEESARMAMEVGEDYPLLLLVNRAPKELNEVMIIGSTETKMYTFRERKSKREGDKVQHTFYDGGDEEKTNGAEKWVAEILDSLKKELKDRGLTSKKLLSADEVQKVAVCREIARALGIRGMAKQEDVYGFLKSMMDRI